MHVLVGYLKKYLLFGTLAYALMFVIANFLLSLPQTYIFSSSELRHWPTIIFAVCWLLAMTGTYLWFSRSLKVNLKEMFLHMGIIVMLAPICEVVINTLCRFAADSPLWMYHVFTVHNGDTSKFSFFAWAIYGCHLYFMDRKFIHSSARYRTILFALILSLDAICMEFFVNITSIYYLHTYIFFYLPNDVQHLTTLAVVPFYFVCGLLAAEVLRRSFKRPILFGSLGLLIGFVFIFLA